MSGKIPKRVQINGQWFDANGWMGALELTAFGSPIRYKASEPFVHISSLYHVYDANGNKVGEFNTEHRTCSGCVTSFEV